MSEINFPNFNTLLTSRELQAKTIYDLFRHLKEIEKDSEAYNALRQEVQELCDEIRSLDPSMSEEEAIQALAAKQAIVEADLSALGPKCDHIEVGNAQEDADTIVFEDNEGNAVGTIDADGADFKSLKSDGKKVVVGNDFVVEGGKVKKVSLNGSQVPIGGEEVVMDAEHLSYDKNVDYSDGTIGKEVKSLATIKKKLDEGETEDVNDRISFTSDDGTTEFAYVDKDGIHAKNIYDLDGNKYNRSCKSINHVGDSTTGGMSSQGSIAWYLRKYCAQIGFTMNMYGRGGENTDAMMAYLGCGPMILPSAITIPASGSVSFSPKSSLIGANGNLLDFKAFSQFSDTNSRISITDVSIGGIKGTISANQAKLMAGVVFYNSNGYVTQWYGQDDYATNITGLSINATKMRVCINARSASDVLQSSCHISINGQAMELISHINIADTYLGQGGGLIEEEGFYTSEEIDLTGIGTITNLYLDGLATSTSLVFTRKESGQETIVEKGSMVIADNYTIGKSGVITAYINNFRFTGIDKADDWAQQMHKILGYTDDKKFILGSSHYFGSTPTYSGGELEKVESRLKYEFGEHYFSGYEYLKDCGVQDAIRFGVLTQQQVDDAIANGNQNLPEWQRPFQNPTYGDFLHFNVYASYLIARKFITIGINLGYWEAADYSFNTLYNN